ncbi:MAG: porin family protein [Steroidobacteraceae bacterium]
MSSYQRSARGPQSLALLVLLAFLGTVAAADAKGPSAQLIATVAAAEGHINAGEHAAAYDLLLPLEEEGQAVPRYNLALGVAALALRHDDIALRAFRRLEATDPERAVVRFGLAQALYQSGELDEAEERFRAIAQTAASEKDRAAAQNYLKRIAGERRADRRYNVNLGLAVGYDSNANFATADNEYLGLPIRPEDVKQDTAFAEARADLGISHRFSDDRQLRAKLAASYRSNPDAPFVDQGVAGLELAYGYRLGAWRGAVVADYQQRWLDNTEYREEIGGELRFDRALPRGWLFGVVGRAARLDFNAPRYILQDANRYLLALSADHRDWWRKGSVTRLTLFGGGDEVSRFGSPYGNRRFGARSGVSLPLAGKTRFSAEVLYSWIRYDNARGFLGERRVDHLGFAQLALEIPGRLWHGATLVPRLRYIRSSSSVDLYDYDRLEATLFLVQSL